ncbi:hypothetical protein FNV43_RR27094 [Rhamnella rubrinervis]|uniref:Uncharacterized protein n=1 Tax=Rhamnella rubrinervis TaxID=2594499 RepID=A0A8K0GN59_9ROSA|nr:hypothetical protein FNV43_RR27094 [Rhamnella rubrinervis]
MPASSGSDGLNKRKKQESMKLVMQPFSGSIGLARRKSNNEDGEEEEAAAEEVVEGEEAAAEEAVVVGVDVHKYYVLYYTVEVL